MEFASQCSRLETIQVFPVSDADVKKFSHVLVENSKQIENNAGPFENGIYDARMGGQFNYNCGTCALNSFKCISHFGSFNLATAIENPVYSKFVLKWMQIICDRCCRIIFDVDIKLLYPDFNIESFKNTSDQFEATMKYLKNHLTSRSKKVFCDHCNKIAEQVESGVIGNKKFSITYVQPQYTESSVSKYFADKLVVPPTGNAKQYSKGADFGSKDILLPADKLAILESLADSEIIKLGLNILSHPRHYIIRILPIPPVNMRFINNSRSKNEKNSGITGNLEAIIKCSQSLGDFNKNDSSFGFDDKTSHKTKCHILIKMIEAYSQYQGIGDTGENKDGLYLRFKGKTGLLRQSGVGKVVATNITRTVIVCKPDIPPDRYYISRRFAHQMYIKDFVTPFNLRKMQVFANNCDIYPGCSKITRKVGNNDILIKNTPNQVLQLGDIIHRNIITGDCMLFNRSPTISTTSISMHRVIVHEGKKDINFSGMNILSCAAYQADFDGDAMIGKAMNNPAAREESIHTMSFGRFLMRYENGEMITGLAQDSAIGCAMLTTHGVVFSRFEAMKLFSGIPIDFKLDQETYTGREIFSIVMPPINYRAPSPMFKEKLVKLLGDYDESDYEIVIVKGKLLSGIVCGGAVKGKAGGIYHIIASNMGSERGLDTVYYHQQIIAKFLVMHGSTISYADIRLGKESKVLIDLIQSTIMRQVSEFNNLLLAGKIIPPIELSLAQHVENEMSRILNPGMKYFGAIAKTVNIRENWLFQLVLTGTKGSTGNLFSIFTSVGQLKIDGIRLPNTLGYCRFSINSRQFSDDPQDRGFVATGFAAGYSARDTLAAGQETRRNILTKSVVTAEAGYKSKLIIHAGESAVVDHRLFTVRGYGLNIIEFNSIDDGFQSACCQTNVVILLAMSDSEIEYHYGKRSDMMRAERDLGLGLREKLQNNNPIYQTSNKIQLPIDIDQLISMSAGKDTKDFEANWKLLDEFSDTLYYLRTNDRLKDQGVLIPKCIQAPFTMLRIALKSAFTKEIASMFSKTSMGLLLDLFREKITKAFFQPGDAIGNIMGQAFAGPMTQYLIDAHHVSITGGTSKDAMNYCMGLLQRKDLKSSSTKIMYIYLKPEYETDLKIVKRLSEYIASKKLISVLEKTEILYEFDHATYPEDAAFCASYVRKANIVLNPSQCYQIKFRLFIGKNKLLAKSVKIEDLFSKVEYLYGNDVIMVDVTDPKSDTAVILMYFTLGFNWLYVSQLSDKLKKKEYDNSPAHIWTNILSFFQQFSNDTTINEFKGIEGTKIQTIEKFVVVDGVVVKRPIYYIQTVGVNMKDIMLINIVDSSRTGCNNGVETYKYKGLIAAKLRIVGELDNIMAPALGVFPQCYSLLSNLIIETGYLSPISDTGYGDRESKDTFLRMCNKSPIEWISSMATNADYMQFTSPTSDIVLGQSPRYIGTTRDRVIVNMDFITKHKQSVKSISDMI